MIDPYVLKASNSCDLEYWQRMSFGVEDVPVQRQQVLVVTEQQEQVLERLREVERLHVVLVTNMLRVFNVADRRVAVFDSRVFFERLKDLCAPLAVRLVSSGAI